MQTSYLQIGEDGKEKYGPLTEDDILDGRPMAEDVVDWFEVDCTTNPLICQLRGQPINELEEQYTGEVVHEQSPEIDGFPQFTNICGGCGLGGDPYREGDYNYYINEITT